ncbi:M4 family metallopeptidase [Arsenicicoccus dermatophilus]|uniref:M4 family metallopeptidase n=1 Tax=Arsenicicoccus dermatophilus TaxID=1076331 RepID=UPI0038927E76
MPGAMGLREGRHTPRTPGAPAPSPASSTTPARHRDYDNAFWDGQQMVFGDGDGVYFASFTDCVDVVGHELTHGLTQLTAGLTYVARSGALNESISDAFGVLTKQHALGQTAAEADWLIGAGLFTAKVRGIALRSMKAPGTAYDDPHLGKDRQPASMSGYQDLSHDDAGDNGGVHINSGIPHRAFYLVADALGGHAWERAGQIWWDTLLGVNGPALPKDCDFATFARHTLTAATERYGARSREVDAVPEAWRTVEVTSARP